jgi:hypothetical protein
MGKEKRNRIQRRFYSVEFDDQDLHACAEYEIIWDEQKQEWGYCLTTSTIGRATSSAGKFQSVPQLLAFFDCVCWLYCLESIPVLNFKLELVEHLRSVLGFSKPMAFEESTWMQPPRCGIVPSGSRRSAKRLFVDGMRLRSIFFSLG